MTPRRGTVAANGLEFAYLEWGSGPLVLCLHGYPDTAWTWRKVAPLLEGRRVVAPFMRGYAPTGFAPDGDYSIRALAADAVALKWALVGDAPAVLVGHDWGAAAAHCVPPGVFERVVTLAVPPFERLEALGPAELARQARASWYMAFNQVRGVSERMVDHVIPRLWATWSPGYDATEDLAHLWDAWPTPAHRTAALNYYRAIRPGLRTTVESSYLHGADDGCLLPAVARPGELVAGAGHFIQLQQPQRVADTVLP